jgi:CubicO group peptidase (beta-lactamase class C family)
MTESPRPLVNGRCDPRFEALRERLGAQLESGADLGASVSVTLEGETVVDLWGGFADEARREPWREDTLVNVWSTTKTMTFLAALVLVERGELDLDAKVARYWPAFAARGKEEVPVRFLLGHTSGVSGWDPPVTLEDIYDWEKSTAMLASQTPWWKPGTASGYHALNQGHLIGEVVRRITGRSLGRFFAEEIAGPLGADFHIGLDARHDARVSNVVPPTSAPIDLDGLDPKSPMYKTFLGPAPSAEAAWTTAWRRAEVPAANGHGNARSVARLQAIVANGGAVDGVRLLSPATIARVFEVQADGTDLVLGLPVRFGMGYGLPSPATPHLPEGRIGWWGGWGGSAIVVDTDRRMTIAYVMNRMEASLLGDPRGFGVIQTAYAALGLA